MILLDVSFVAIMNLFVKLSTGPCDIKKLKLELIHDKFKSTKKKRYLKFALVVYIQKHLQISKKIIATCISIGVCSDW